MYCTRRARRKHSHRPAKALQKQKVFFKQKYNHHVNLCLQLCLLYILLSSSTTPPGFPSSGAAAITTISLPRLVMVSGGKKIGDFIFNLIFDLARIERAAMMMMMMMTMSVVRIFSIRKTAAALVFVSRKFRQKLTTC